MRCNNTLSVSLNELVTFLNAICLFSTDVMAELQNLMTSVADQMPDSNSKKWQHPSDLTCRYIILTEFLSGPTVFHTIGN